MTVSLDTNEEVTVESKQQVSLKRNVQIWLEYLNHSGFTKAETYTGGNRTGHTALSSLLQQVLLQRSQTSTALS